MATAKRLSPGSRRGVSMSGNRKEKRLQPITGWASGGNTFHDEHEQAVVIGPDATASGLLSWGIGQLQQLNVLVDAVSGATEHSGAIDPAEVCGAIRHQLEQIEGALVGAASLLRQQDKTNQPA
jgi:hypothetical protein